MAGQSEQDTEEPGTEVADTGGIGTGTEGTGLAVDPGIIPAH